MNPILYAKVGAVLLTVAVLFGAGFHFGGMRAEATLNDYKASAAEALADAYVAQQKAAQAKQVAYDKEIDGLKSAVLTYPTVAVRMCPTSHPVVPQTGGGGQVIPTSAGTLPPSDPPARDIGPALFALADEADAIVAKCRAL